MKKAVTVKDRKTNEKWEIKVLLKKPPVIASTGEFRRGIKVQRIISG